MRWRLLVAALLVAVSAGLLFGKELVPRAEPKQAPLRDAGCPAPCTNGGSVPGRTATRTVRRRSTPLDVTFFVAADTHVGFGADDDKGRDPLLEPNRLDLLNLRQIRAMNDLPGRPYPRELGGRVARPRGVFIAGDLTDAGGPEDYRLFRRLYAPSSEGGLLEFPLYAMAGNHDRQHDWYIREQIAREHGDRFYSVALDDLEVICLGEAPDEMGLQFLDRTLATLSSEVPIVVMLHYPLAGPFSDTQWFGRGNYRQRLAKALQGRPVLGIFHGHYHASAAYVWEGYDVYNVGSPMYLAHSFAVVHVQEHRMQVVSLNYQLGDWWWWHDKPILGASAERRAVIGRVPKGALRPRLAL